MSNDRLKFSFMWQHQETGRWLDKRYTFVEVLNGEPYDDMSDQPLLRKYHHVATRQWTGLYDSEVEGQEIYAGDVLQPKAYLKTKFGRAQVVFRRGSFGLDVSRPFITEYTPLWGALKKSIGAGNGLVIIGNIYENPELVERPND